MAVTVGMGEGEARELKEFEAIEERFTGLEMDDFGNFRVSVEGEKSPWKIYQSIATLKKDGKQYLGVSAYYDGNLPIECVLEVKPLITIYSKKPKEERIKDEG
jgi:hypothetical protein